MISAGIIVSGITAIALVVGTIISSFRSLRIAQREHYLPGSVTRFSLRWWLMFKRNRALAVVCVASTVASFYYPPTAFLVGVILMVAPLGLRVRGRSARLAWTRRLKLVATLVIILQVASAVLGLTVWGPAGVAVSALANPVLVDLSLWLDKPFEKRLAKQYVRRASLKLDKIAPLVVAITGSYGKTSTKEYARHLIARTKNVVASPASYNNTAGLTRTVNDFLTPGTDVLIAEVGTYGIGEIEEICTWLKPSISAITAIGPVHLERMGTIDTIVSAKSEILSTSRSAIFNVECLELERLAEQYENKQKVTRVGSNSSGISWRITGDEIVFQTSGQELGRTPTGGAQPSNIAVAIAIAREVGVPNAHIAEQIKSLPTPQHRLEVVVSDVGTTVVDDTYNSNPAGATAALKTLQNKSRSGARTAVVTPGMVELGSRQRAENVEFARQASAIASDLVIVGRTNRDALEKGAEGGSANVVLVSDRAEAVKWVRNHLAEDDAVLYENDLPDHFP